MSERPSLPLAPLLAALTPSLTEDGQRRPPSMTCAVERLEVGMNRVRRWARDGLTVDEADMMAGRLKAHPFDVWGVDWNRALAEQVEADEARYLVEHGRTCAADDCSTVFAVSPFGRGGHGRRYCSDTCSSRVRMRKIRATDEGKRKNRATVARYKREVREAATRRAERRAA